MRILVAGHVDHGKTTFICALNSFLFHRYGIGSADRACPTMDENNCVLSQKSVTYSMGGVDYTYIDYPGEADYVDMFEAGEEHFDAALIVCAATDGPMPGTRSALRMCRDAGIEKFVVFINKTDDMYDPDMIEIMSMELAEVAAEEGCFDLAESIGSGSNVVTGSAICALENPKEIDGDCIYEVIEAVQRVCAE